jgi:type I restriction enzyme S subunit
MNTGSLQENFGHLADAPGGVGRIRDLILQLAFTGALVEHSNESSAQLVERLAELEHPDGKARRATDTEAIPLYNIPGHWEWVNISLIGHDWGQQKPTKAFTYIDVSAIDNKRGVISEDAKVTPANRAPSRARKVVRRGTVIYSTVRPYLLNIAVVDRDFAPIPIASTAFAILHPFEGVEARFVYHYLRSPAFVSYVESVQSGIAYPAISDKKFFAASFPLPPTNEQKRIVAKVDELMSLCDKLEAWQQARKSLIPALSHACTTSFSESPTPATLKRLFDETGAVSPSDLRKSILTLAVQGKLVPQDPDDEPAEELISRIADLRRAMKAKEYAPVTDDDAPYEVPLSWSWIRLGNISLTSDSGWSPQCHPMSREGNNWGVLKVSAVSWGVFKPEENKALPLGMEARPDCEVRPGDFLLTRANTEELVARSVVVDQTPPRLMMSDKIVRFTFPSEIEKAFINLANSSDPSRGYYARNASGTSSSMKNVGREVMCNLPIPIPPLAEQRRIVAKVDELMGLVDELETKLTKRDELAEAYAGATVATITGTRTEESKPMRAPKTELITELKIGTKPKAGDEAPLARLIAKNKGGISAKGLWQLSDLKIDVFYQQLKVEISHGWIAPPVEAEMKILEKV